jgi:hypothetical protein
MNLKTAKALNLAIPNPSCYAPTRCSNEPGDVCFWHKADIGRPTPMSAFGGTADIDKRAAMSAYDPSATSASNSCCSGEGDFSLYQSTRLNRYDAAY